MFTRLQVINFQNVLSFDELLSPGMNLFSGRSGNGKTARALRSTFWIAQNQPDGDNYLYDPRKTGNRNWEPAPTSVTLWTSTTPGAPEHEVKRIRYSKSLIKTLYKEGWVKVIPKLDDINAYILDGNTLTGFGTGVPDTVKKVLNLSYINFQFQHSRRKEDPRYSQINPLYILSMSPPELARVLNDLAGLDDIDEALSFVNKLKNEEQTAFRTSEIQRDAKIGELLKYDRLDALELAVKDIDNKSNQIVKKEVLIQSMVEALSSLNKAEQENKAFQKLPQLREQVDLIVAMAEKLNECERRIREMNRVRSEYESARLKLKSVQNDLEEAKVEWELNKPDTCPTCGKVWG